MPGADISVVTSYSVAGWCEYGYRFVQTFRRYWPTDVTLLRYGEEENSQHVNLLAVPRCAEFLARYAGQAEVAGRQQVAGHPWKANAVTAGYNFRFDALKFARKVFAIEHAAEALGWRGKLFWVDADVTTFAPVPREMLERLLPDDAATCYLGRNGGYHSECGFVGYNLEHPVTPAFIRVFANEYASGVFENLGEWHDSYVYDRVRERLGVPGYSIPSSGRGHVFAQSELGRYMDHLKGPERKALGFSPERVEVTA